MDLNECDFHPCGPGAKCHNIEKGRGWYCECPEKFTCTNCSCNGDFGMGSQRDKSLGLGSSAMIIIAICIISYLSKTLRSTLISSTSKSSKVYDDQDTRHYLFTYFCLKFCSNYCSLSFSTGTGHCGLFSQSKT